MIKQLVVASSNSGKLREIHDILTQSMSQEIEILPQNHFAIESAEETAVTFIENALIKARHASLQSGLPALADDSGLEVDALHGAPGVYSARYAGIGATDAANIDKLLLSLAGMPAAKRTARFRCVMVLLRHANDPSPLIAQGVWEGVILEAPQGEGGFGYDPVFWVPEQAKTAAAMDRITKNGLSHRGQALSDLARQVRAGALFF